MDAGLFFSRLAVVTFGGAYGVLSYLAQEVVEGYGWITTGQLMGALGLAETAPGPLIVGRDLCGMPGRPRLQGALAAITAAVAGVILNLSVWCARHVLFGEVAPFAQGSLRLDLLVPASFKPLPAALARLAGWLLLGRYWPPTATLGLVGALSLLLHALRLA